MMGNQLPMNDLTHDVFGQADDILISRKLAGGCGHGSRFLGSRQTSSPAPR